MSTAGPLRVAHLTTIDVSLWSLLRTEETTLRRSTTGEREPDDNARAPRASPVP